MAQFGIIVSIKNRFCQNSFELLTTKRMSVSAKIVLTRRFICGILYMRQGGDVLSTLAWSLLAKAM